MTATTIFHCENKYGVYHRDNRECSCSEQPPPSKKKKAGKQKQASGDQQSFADLRKLHHNLQKEHEQNLKVQNKELAQDLAELVADKLWKSWSTL